MLGTDILTYLAKTSEIIERLRNEKYSFFINEVKDGAKPITLIIKTVNDIELKLLVAKIMSDAILLCDYIIVDGKCVIKPIPTLVPFSAIVTIDAEYD